MITDNLPELPGCYLYKDKEGKIIYVGKAKDIKKRVLSYYSKRILDEKTKSLVENVADVEFFVTANEVEAFLLESNLIRKHQPKYNIDLKASSRYAHILVTDEQYPRLLVARNKEIRGRVYGPFVSAEKRDLILKSLKTSFQIRTCSRLPKKSCLRHHLGLCCAPCIDNIGEAEYNERIKRIESFLKGNTDSLIKELTKEMLSASDKRQFEKARELRDQIFAVKSLSERQKVELEKSYDEDIIDFLVRDGIVYLILFNINKGVLTTKREFSFDYHEGFLSEFITQFYAENKLPKELILRRELPDKGIRAYLESLRNGPVTITVPKKGDKLGLLNLVKENIEVSFFTYNKMLSAARDELKLTDIPRVIECFDISNISGTYTAGSMVQFREGIPDKSNYRRFRIRTFMGIDDFAGIYEVVKRRYYGQLIGRKEMPDLILIDGGRGQLDAGLKALQELGLKIPMLSLAKRLEEIYVPGLSHPLRLRKDSKALKLLIQIRNEAHRFAINYHKLLRSKGMLE